MPTLNFNSHSIYFEEQGSGPPLVLIAGLASDSQSWLPVVDTLSKNFHVITFDNRGTGRSSQDNSGITIQKMADDCAELIRHLKISPANILGHSMGGMIAMDLSIRYPELVNKLILEATTPKLNNRTANLFNDWAIYLKSEMDKQLWFKNLFYWIFSSDFFEDNEIVEQAVKLAIDCPYTQSDNSFENQVLAMSKFNHVSELNKIKLPTLIIRGENDILFPFSESEEYFKNITCLQKRTISRAAHSIHIENPEDFCKSVVNFLNS